MNAPSEKIISSETVQPHHGASGVLQKGQRLRIVDLEGQHVTDFIAVKRDDPLEYQDMIYSNLENGRYQWQVGDTLIWDNRCLLHRGTGYDADRWRRRMRQTRVAGSGPTLEE